jgi:hypothetical protein
MKKIFAAIFLVVLVLGSFSILSMSHVRAQSGQAEVLSYRWYVADSNTVLAQYIDDLMVVGEVQNTGSSPLQSVWVVANAYASNGTLLDTSQNSALGVDLGPGQKAPFYIDFDPDYSTMQTDQSWVPSVVNVTAQVYSTPATNQTQYSGLTISDVTGDNSSGVYTVSGTIQDTGSQGVSDMLVIGTFYNAAGSVVTLNYTDLGEGVNPGGSVFFSMTPADLQGNLGSTITNYSVLINSIPVTATATPTPVQTTNPTSTPNSSTNTTQASGSVPLTTYGIVVAIVVVIVVAVLAVLILSRKRTKTGKLENLPPPPPPPT